MAQPCFHEGGELALLTHRSSSHMGGERSGVFTVGHFALGAAVGILVDAKVVGPITKHERHNQWLLLAKLCLQLMLFGLIRHYLGMLLQHVPVGNPHVRRHEGGWAMAIGIITAHQNMFARFQLLSELWA